MKLFLYLMMTVFLSLSAPPLVHADAESDAGRKASQHFRRGVSLYREGAFRAALIEFERGYAVKPHYRLLYNMGETYLQLAEYLAASDTLLRYLEEGGTEIPPERRDDVEQKLARLRERVALISVSVNRAGAEIFIDDKSVGTSPMVRGVSVNVGRHRVSVRSSDGATASEVVDLAGGDVKELSFALEEKVRQATPAAIPAPVAGSPNQERAEPAPSSLYRKLALGSFVGAGVLAAGTITGVFLQRGMLQSYKDAADAPGADPNDLASKNEAAWRAAVVTDVLGGLTVAAAAAGVTFLVMDRKNEDPDQPELSIGFAGARLLLQGGF